MIIPVSELGKVRASNREKIIGFTSGCFDMFHHLHLAYLQRCKMQCDLLVIGVDSDEAIKTIKGPHRPIIPWYQRADIVHSLRIVHSVIKIDDLTSLSQACQNLRPDRFFKNESFLYSEISGAEYCGMVEIIPDIGDIVSTSRLIERIGAYTP